MRYFVTSPENKFHSNSSLLECLVIKELRSKANSPIGSTGSESTKSETPSSNSGEERKVSSDSDSGKFLYFYLC
jgi:hypothetical protein